MVPGGWPEVRKGFVSTVSTSTSLWAPEYLSRRPLGHRNGPSARRATEAGRQPIAAVGELLAAQKAEGEDASAELHVLRGGEALRARCREALGPADVHSAIPCAVFAVDGVAVDHGGGLGFALRKRVEGLADEGQIGVGGLEPVQHLLVGFDERGRRELCRDLVSTMWEE